MKCPFTGKPCLLPKEVFVTEIHGDTIQNLFLCKQCGDQYIAQLSEHDKITKSLEVIAAGADSITHSEHIIDEGDQLQPPSKITYSLPVINDLALEAPKKPPLLPQIKKVEARMQEASDKEDYESAAKLRDILKLLKAEYAEEQKKSE